MPSVRRFDANSYENDRKYVEFIGPVLHCIDLQNKLRKQPFITTQDLANLYSTFHFNFEQFCFQKSIVTRCL